MMFDFDELDPLADVNATMAPGAPAIHTGLPDNGVHRLEQGKDFDDVRKSAPVKVTRTFKLARRAMVPLEGRGVVALWDERVSQLVNHSSTQSPLSFATALAGFLQEN